jgi:hypothetical protein
LYQIASSAPTPKPASWIRLRTSRSVARGYHRLHDATKGNAMAANVKEKVATARPVVERIAKDQKFQNHVKGAYGSAKTIYDELFAEASLPSEAASRKVVARLTQDPELQDELRNVFAELRSAGQRAKTKAAKPSHKGRNALLLAGIVVGILYNPKTGPDTRKWLKDRIVGADDTFDFETDLES